MCASIVNLCYIHVNKYKGEKMQKNSCYGEKRTIEIEQQALASHMTPNIWKSFASFVRAGTTNRPVTNWSNPSTASPNDPSHYITIYKNTTGGKGDGAYRSKRNNRLSAA
jgi:hypothetical protein